MPRPIYRNDAGHAEIRAWCEDGLTAADLRPGVIDTNLGATSYVTAGAGHDVVVLPGTNLATATWTSLVHDIAAAGRAVGFDLPGQPGLSAAERPDDRGAYGSWLHQVIRRLELDRPVVVGHSLGALVGLLAASHGSAIGGLVLLAPAGLVRLRVSAAILGTSLRWVRRRDDEASRNLVGLMSGPGRTPPDELTTWMTLVARHVRTSLAPRPLPTAILAAVRCPVRVVTGSHDAFLPPRKVGAAAGALSGPTMATEVAGAGHLLPLEEPGVVAAAVRETIARARASSPPDH